jgi:hypothetical protein
MMDEINNNSNIDTDQLFHVMSVDVEGSVADRYSHCPDGVSTLLRAVEQFGMAVYENVWNWVGIPVRLLLAKLVPSPYPTTVTSNSENDGSSNHSSSSSGSSSNSSHLYTISPREFIDTDPSESISELEQSDAVGDEVIDEVVILSCRSTL